MRELIYTDPHHGVELKAHTTTASRKRLRDSITEHVLNILLKEADLDTAVICGGDFFHSFSNSEEVILGSLPSFWRTNLLLEGNHDVSNNRDARSSTFLLKEMTELLGDLPEVPCIVTASYGETNVIVKDFGSKLYVLVPHHTTQQLFESALEAATELAKSSRYDGKRKLLITHCNYDSPFATDDTSLNLLQQTAKKLLTSFDYIILGHEHNSKTDLDDRVIVLGSPHPTNFGDISDKYVLAIDDNCDMELIPVWEKEKHYLEADWKTVTDIGPEIQFVRLKGAADPGEVPTLAKLIKSLWKTGNAYAIRSDVQITRVTHEGVPAEGGGSLFHVKQLIDEELKGTDLEELWKEVSGDN